MHDLPSALLPSEEDLKRPGLSYVEDMLGHSSIVMRSHCFRSSFEFQDKAQSV